MKKPLIKTVFRGTTLVAVVALSTLASMALTNTASAVTVQIPPSKDNTLYQNATGSLSNGAGWYFFVGRTGQVDNISRRRGVIAFRVADSIPPAATIQTVTLTLHMSRTFTSTLRTIPLRKLLSDWGEGSSNAAGEEGSGAASTTNSATWIHQFYNTDLWTTAGGDFSGTTSASISVSAIGFYTFGSTVQMVADVQDWLDDPANNFGWLLLGSEGLAATAKRFDTKENPTVANRPILTVTYEPPCCVGIRGDVNDDGADGTILDLNYMVNDIFRGGPSSPCPQEADLDNNGTPSTITDLNFLVNDIFRGGPSAPACP